MKNTLTSQGMLRDIQLMLNVASQLLKSENSYNEFLKFIIENYSENKRYTIKELSEQTKIKYEMCRKYVRQIYDDILHGDRVKFAFPKTQYDFSLTYLQKYYYFTVDELSFIPKVGEKVEFHFLREYMGTYWFYVNSVDHIFQDDLHTVVFELIGGEYNLYWHLRRDEAFFKNEIDIETRFSYSEARLKRFLFPNRLNY